MWVASVEYAVRADGDGAAAAVTPTSVTLWSEWAGATCEPEAQEWDADEWSRWEAQVRCAPSPVGRAPSRPVATRLPACSPCAFP